MWTRIKSRFFVDSIEVPFSPVSLISETFKRFSNTPSVSTIHPSTNNWRLFIDLIICVVAAKISLCYDVFVRGVVTWKWKTQRGQNGTHRVVMEDAAMEKEWLWRTLPSDLFVHPSSAGPEHTEKEDAVRISSGFIQWKWWRQTDGRIQRRIWQYRPCNANKLRRTNRLHQPI